MVSSPRKIVLAGTLILGSAAAGSSGCGGTAAPRTCGEPTWEAEVEDLLAHRCVSCHLREHRRGAVHDLATYAGARDLADRVRARVIEEGTMPPVTSHQARLLSDEERARLGEWIALGAPERCEDLGAP